MKKLIQKNPKRLKIRKNPFIYEYGYHLTKSSLLPSILKHGLKTSKDNFEVNEFFYNGKKPTYFLVNPNVRHLSEVGKQFLQSKILDIMLKVKVKQFEQLVDLNTLLEGNSDFYAQKMGYNGLKYESSEFKIVYFKLIYVICYEFAKKYFEEKSYEDEGKNWKFMTEMYSYKNLYKKPLLKKWFEFYNSNNLNTGGIPLIDFKTNLKLATDTIITTQSFAIDQNISAENIVDYWEVEI